MFTILAPTIPVDFRGAAKRLDDIDIPRIAASIDTGEDELRALIEVESRGYGFDKTGRPIILFEPHIFCRLLKGAQRERAVAAGLAYPNWGQKPYPKDSYPRLLKAIAIDRNAALQACSWGLPQIMGANHKAAGFGSVEEMVVAFCSDEEHHLAAMVRFLKTSGLDDDLRNHRWAALARGYNGPGYAKHGYHTRLAAAFARWQQKPDTPLPEAAEQETAFADPRIEEIRARESGATFAERAKIKAVQERLGALGYHMVGMPDGVIGTRTIAAVAAFQRENDLPITGEITPALITALEDAEPMAVSPVRADGEPQGSRIVQGGRETAGVGGALGLTGAIASAPPFLEQAETLKSFVDRLRALFEPVRELLADHWPLVLVVLGAFIVWRGTQIVQARIEDHQNGKTA